MRSSLDQRPTQPQLRECPGCGLFQTVPALSPGMTARCVRCPTVLRRTSRHRIDHIIALTAAAFVLLVVMCTTTLMSVETSGIKRTANLFSGPWELVRQDMSPLALVIVFVTVLAPLGRLLGMLYVLIRLHERRQYGDKDNNQCERAHALPDELPGAREQIRGALDARCLDAH